MTRSRLQNIQLPLVNTAQVTWPSFSVHPLLLPQFYPSYSSGVFARRLHLYYLTFCGTTHFPGLGFGFNLTCRTSTTPQVEIRQADGIIWVYNALLSKPGSVGNRALWCNLTVKSRWKPSILAVSATWYTCHTSPPEADKKIKPFAASILTESMPMQWLKMAAVPHSKHGIQATAFPPELLVIVIWIGICVRVGWLYPACTTLADDRQWGMESQNFGSALHLRYDAWHNIITSGYNKKHDANVSVASILNITPVCGWDGRQQSSIRAAKSRSLCCTSERDRDSFHFQHASVHIFDDMLSQ